MKTLSRVGVGPCTWDYYHPGGYENRVTVSGRLGFWYVSGKEFLTLKAAETYVLSSTKEIKEVGRCLTN